MTLVWWLMKIKMLIFTLKMSYLWHLCFKLIMQLISLSDSWSFVSIKILSRFKEVIFWLQSIYLVLMTASRGSFHFDAPPPHGCSLFWLVDQSTWSFVTMFYFFKTLLSAILRLLTKTVGETAVWCHTGRSIQGGQGTVSGSYWCRSQEAWKKPRLCCLVHRSALEL